jgi:hypothetical protein
LARTIEAVWGHQWDDSVVEKVYQRWKRVLKLIIADGGDNRLTDSHRGELFKAFALPIPELEVEDSDEDDDDSANEGYD